LARTTSRSESFVAAALVLFALPGVATPAATIERVFPLAPAAGESVGPVPLFELGYAALGGDETPRLARFRITLRPLSPTAPSYEFDQRADAGGWMLGEEWRVLYRPRLPLADGVYGWQPWFWNGNSWIRGTDEFRFRVDSVPPAEIGPLRVSRSPSGVVLDWDPVTLDRDGRPEFVARYYVYRYERAADARVIRSHRIAEVVAAPFVDTIAVRAGSEIVFYRVTAEDEAGNEPGRRD
jgi:hypothetical protein